MNVAHFTVLDIMGAEYFETPWTLKGFVIIEGTQH